MKEFLVQTNYDRKKYLPIVTMLLIAIALISLTFPQVAYAGPFDAITDPAGFVKSLIMENIIGPMIDAMWSVAMAPTGSMASTALVSGSFYELFGEFNAGSIYTFLETCNKSVLVPLAESILALALIVQFLKISQKIDANGTLPVVKEILMLILFYAIALWLIKNAMPLCASIYDVVAKIIVSLRDLAGATGPIGESALQSDWGEVNLGVAMVMFIGAFFVFFANCLAFVVSYVVCLARAVQLYVMAAFSPLPLSFLTIDETRQWGVGFIKAFISLCLAGAIIVIMIYIYPLMMVSCIPSQLNVGDLLGTLTSELKMIAVSILFVYGLCKSGAWARDILGG